MFMGLAIIGSGCKQFDLKVGSEMETLLFLSQATARKNHDLTIDFWLVDGAAAPITCNCNGSPLLLAGLHNPIDERRILRKNFAEGPSMGKPSEATLL